MQAALRPLRFAPLAAALFCATITLVAAARPAQAAITAQPFHWSKAAFRDNGQAVESLTIRAKSGGLETFIRFAMANAGFKDGELTISFRQETANGTIYAKETFDEDDYTVFADHLGLKAGKHLFEFKNGQLVGTFDFGTTKASVTMTTSAGSLALMNRSGPGYVSRALLVPIGRVTVQAQDATRNATVTATGFCVHEASTATAHQVYDRSVQLHSLVGGNYMIVDYIVMPASRGGKPFGFVVVSGKGKTFVGEVVSETRENEKVDSAIDYQVPYTVSVLAKRGEGRAAVRLTAEKQVSREDDLADLNFLARKAVGALMHPVTYTLKARADAEVQTLPTEPAVALTANVRFKYSQVR
ncbi:MAG: hypothetical protein ACOYOB_01665 [Myxococcota bacterium]